MKDHTEPVDSDKSRHIDRSETVGKPLSPKGRAAMQGRTEMPMLDKGQLRGAEVKAARDVKAPSPGDRSENKLTAYERKLQGQIAEQSMRETGAEPLNDYKPNSPVYDFITPHEAASVKTHMPSEKHPQSYLSALACPLLHPKPLSIS